MLGFILHHRPYTKASGDLLAIGMELVLRLIPLVGFGSSYGAVILSIPLGTPLSLAVAWTFLSRLRPFFDR